MSALMQAIKCPVRTDVPVLRVGVWHEYFQFDQHTHVRLPACPPSFRWVNGEDDPARVDVIMETQKQGGARLHSHHPRKVLYLQETTEHHGNRRISLYERFDLLLTNDRELLEHPALRDRAAYQTLFGTWIPKAEITPKTKLCSLLASRNNFLSGHRIRHAVLAANLPGLEAFGLIVSRPLPYHNVRLAYDAFQFNLAIENSNYPWWHTEKLFNCFATKTVPIYWGCSDFSQLEAWGFDGRGIVPWDGRVDTLRELLASPPEVDEAAIDRNFARVHELWCHEITLEKVLRERFDL